MLRGVLTRSTDVPNAERPVVHSQAYLHGGPVPAPGRCLAAPIIILLQGEEKKEKNALACLCVSKPITAREGGGGGGE